MSVTTFPSRGAALRQPGWLARLFDYKPFLIVMCLAPAIGLLLVFLTYPLGLGIWLAFTDTRIGRSGIWVGLENFQRMLGDTRLHNSLIVTFTYVIVGVPLQLAAALLLGETVTTLPEPMVRDRDLMVARDVLGEQAFAALEWSAVLMTTYNRLSVLSHHPVPGGTQRGSQHRPHSPGADHADSQAPGAVGGFAHGLLLCALGSAGL